jgi:hypothetical protein
MSAQTVESLVTFKDYHNADAIFSFDVIHEPPLEPIAKFQEEFQKFLRVLNTRPDADTQFAWCEHAWPRFEALWYPLLVRAGVNNSNMHVPRGSMYQWVYSLEPGSEYAYESTCTRAEPFYADGNVPFIGTLVVFVPGSPVNDIAEGSCMFLKSGDKHVFPAVSSGTSYLATAAVFGNTLLPGQEQPSKYHLRTRG